MKTIGITAVALALALASCHKPVAETAPPPATPAPTPVVAAATPPPETPPPATPARHLAAEGVFYLISWVRIENNDGITGLPPGTGVKLVRPGIYLTPAGESPLSANQITNDLDIARSARDAGLAGRSIANQRQTEEENKVREMEAAAGRETDATRSGQLKVMDREHLTAKLADLQRQKTDLESKISGLSRDNGKEAYDKRYKGTIIANAASDLLPSARADLKSVTQQIRDAQAALAAMK
jgi:hypothetical protein